MPKTPKAIYNPKRLIRIVEQNGKTIVLDEENRPISTELAKRLKAEANDLMATHLWAMMVSVMRSDAVEIGIVKYTEPDHAMYGKAIFHVTGMMDGIIKELSELKIE